MFNLSYIAIIPTTRKQIAAIAVADNTYGATTLICVIFDTPVPAYVINTASE